MGTQFLQYYSSRGISFKEIIILLLVGIILYTLAKAMQTKKSVSGRWHQTFDTVPFSPQELYAKIAELVKLREIPHLSITHAIYSQGGVFSAKREYLRVHHGNCVFDICAAPFGKCYFVSWWMWVYEPGEFIRDFLTSLPIFGKLFAKREKTFFEHDTEAVFRETIKGCVNESIQVLTAIRGQRKSHLDDFSTQQVGVNDFSSSQ